MKISDLLSMCVRNLIRRKFRTFLTVTGVVIGTCAIVVMISLGVGLSASNEALLAQMGDLTMIEVYSQSTDFPLNDEAMAIMQAMPGVVVAAPTMRYNPSTYMAIVSGRKDRYETWAELMGVYPDALEKLGYTAAQGDMTLGSDDKTIRLLFGPRTVYNFYDTKKHWSNNRVNYWDTDEQGNPPPPLFDPVTAEYKLRIDPSKEGARKVEFTIALAGILDVGPEDDWEMQNAMFISIADLKRIRAAYERENAVKKEKNQVDSYDRAKVKVDHIDNVKAVQDAITDLGFYPQSMESMREGMQQKTQQMQLMLGALGAVSLFVAAISITNTMIMSVYERTREIGVMKVLGCLVGNIRTVFLMEAGLIGLMGGVIGVGVSYLLSYLMNRFGSELGASFLGMQDYGQGIGDISIIPMWLVFLGLAFATGIGLASGFYPANRAVGISALEAIKQE